MLRLLLIFCAIWLASSAAQAASGLGCDNIEHPVERAMCNDRDLGLAMIELSALFHYRQSFVITGDTSLLDRDKEWREEVLAACGEDADPVPCIERKFIKRWDELEALPYFIAPPLKLPQTVRIDNVLPSHDFELTLAPAVNCGYDGCMDDRNLIIFAKDPDIPPQAIVLPKVPFLPGENADEVLLNDSSLRLKEANAVLHAEDYNFDGHPDFGLYMGQWWPNGARGYWVFLYNPEDKKFYHAPAFSEMIRAIGVDGDAQSRTYDVFNKSGCCYHENTSYRVEHNMPIPTRRYSLNSSDIEKPDFVIAREEIWRDGDWQLVKEEFDPVEEENQE